MKIKKAFIMVVILGCIWNTNAFNAKEISQSNKNYQLVHESDSSFKVVIYNTIEINEITDNDSDDSEIDNISIEYKNITANTQLSYELTDQQMDDLATGGQIEIVLDEVINSDIYRVYLKSGNQVVHQKSKEDIINTGMTEEELSGEYIRVGDEPYVREVKTERSAICDIEQMKKVAEAGDIFDGGGCSYVVTTDTELPLVDTNRGTIKNINISFASGVEKDTNAILASENEGMIENVLISNPVVKQVENGAFGAITNINEGIILNSRVEDAEITIDYKGSNNNIVGCLAAVSNKPGAFIINDDEYESEKGDYTGSVKITPESEGNLWHVSTTRFNFGYIIGTDALIDGTINKNTYFSQIATINESSGKIYNTMVRGYIEDEESKLNLDDIVTTKINNSNSLRVYSGFMVGNNIGTIEYQEDLYINNIEIVNSYKEAAGILIAVNDGTIELDKNVYISNIVGAENSEYDNFGVISARNTVTAQIIIHGNIDVNGLDLSKINSDSMYVGSLSGFNQGIVKILGNITAADITMTTGDYSGGLFGWSSDKYWPGGEGEIPSTIYIEVGGYIDMSNITISGGANNVGGVIGSGAIDVLGSKEMIEEESTYSIVMQNITIYGVESVGGVAGRLVNHYYRPTHKGWYLNNVRVHGRTNVGGSIGSTYNYATNSKILSGVKEENMHVSGDTNVGGVIGINEGTRTQKNDSYEYIVIADSEITGDTAVGAVSGVNRGTISGASVASDVKVSGQEQVGTLVGLNEGTVDHSFSSGNIYNQNGVLIDSNQREYTNNYVGTLIGQQVNGASLKQSVYDGDSYSSSIYREVGVQRSLEDRASRVNTCVEAKYQVNPSMTIGDYNQLVSAGGECEEEEPDNGERRDNYIADNEFVYTVGNEYQVCVFDYYTENKNTLSASFTPECEEYEKSLPPLPISLPYKVALTIWVGTEIYEIWHVDRPTSDNYSTIELSEGIGPMLGNTDTFGFGNCWNKSVYPPQLYPYNSNVACEVAIS